MKELKEEHDVPGKLFLQKPLSRYANEGNPVPNPNESTRTENSFDSETDVVFFHGDKPLMMLACLLE